MHVLRNFVERSLNVFTSSVTLTAWYYFNQIALKVDLVSPARIKRTKISGKVHNNFCSILTKFRVYVQGSMIISHSRFQENEFRAKWVDTYG